MKEGQTEKVEIINKQTKKKTTQKKTNKKGR